MRFLFIFHLFLGTLIIKGDDYTTEPQNWRTGKLNQFRGFVTPRPLPSEAQYLYSSLWAAWSAWSICVNNVRVRVRACNTVRGFSCPGKNIQQLECTSTEVPVTQPENSDYDVVDPWEEDRREALSQLYPDYAQQKSKSSFKKIASNLHSNPLLLQYPANLFRKVKTAKRIPVEGVISPPRRTISSIITPLRIDLQSIATTTAATAIATTTMTTTAMTTKPVEPSVDAAPVVIISNAVTEPNIITTKSDVLEDADSEDRAIETAKETSEVSSTYKNTTVIPPKMMKFLLTTDIAVIENKASLADPTRPHLEEVSESEQMSTESYLQTVKPTIENPSLNDDSPDESVTPVLKIFEKSAKITVRPKIQSLGPRAKALVVEDYKDYNEIEPSDVSISEAKFNEAMKDTEQKPPFFRKIDPGFGNIAAESKAPRRPALQHGIITEYDDYGWSAARKPKIKSIRAQDQLKNILTDSTNSSLFVPVIPFKLEANQFQQLTPDTKLGQERSTYRSSAEDQDQNMKSAEKSINDEDAVNAIQSLAETLVEKSQEFSASKDIGLEKEPKNKTKIHSGEVEHSAIRRKPEKESEKEKDKKKNLKSSKFKEQQVDDKKETSSEHEANISDEKRRNIPAGQSRLLMKSDKPNPINLMPHQKFLGSRGLSSSRATSAEKAMGSSLVPQFKAAITRRMQNSVKPDIQWMNIIAGRAKPTVKSSKWSEWSHWGKCLCGKKVRTRNCIYEAFMAEGCKGKSFEVQLCDNQQICTLRPYRH